MVRMMIIANCNVLTEELKISVNNSASQVANLLFCHNIWKLISPDIIPVINFTRLSSFSCKVEKIREPGDLGYSCNTCYLP